MATDDETRNAIRQGVAAGLRDDREARDGYGHGTLWRAYQAMHSDETYDPAAIGRKRRNKEADDGGLTC